MLIISAVSFQARTRFEWQLRTRGLTLGERTCIMGIVNVTPDSFSDGGMHASTMQAVAHALRLLDEGATIIDIGGESTRPGAPAKTSKAISAEEEQRRVLPVITGVLSAHPEAMVSIDTYRASTARLAVEAGAEIVNDVSGGLWDTEMFATCAELQCGLLVMHTRGLPSEWASQRPLADDQVVSTVVSGLRERVNAAFQVGIQRQRMTVDPGFGFGKRGGENWVLLAGLEQMHTLGLPVAIGLSRKGFLDAPLATTNHAAGNREDLTHFSDTAAILQGAHLIRVHEVNGAIRSAAVADALLAHTS